MKLRKHEDLIDGPTCTREHVGSCLNIAPLPVAASLVPPQPMCQSGPFATSAAPTSIMNMKMIAAMAMTM